MNRQLRSVHRSMGAIVAVFVMMLAVTGVLLNHTVDFKLDQRYLTWDWLLEHYGVANVEPDAVFLLDQHVISQFDTQVFVDAKPVTHVQRALLGGVVLDDLIVIATDDALILLSPEGEFIERMGSAAGVPAMIQNIGLFHGDPVIQTRDGMFRSDFLLEQWERISLVGIGWSTPQPMPDSVEIELAEYFHGKGITVERLILDIHNGHIVERYGIWILDILALMMIVISLTGLWMWGRQRSRKVTREL
ncbi:peptidase [Methylophaga sp. 42_8_T64]|nr:peptidase [Methylophaga sp. 41_12_T18]OUR89397.1 peptidase [Methylophaga sp. 42_8_T64]